MARAARGFETGGPRAWGAPNDLVEQGDLAQLPAIPPGKCLTTDVCHREAAAHAATLVAGWCREHPPGRCELDSLVSGQASMADEGRVDAADRQSFDNIDEAAAERVDAEDDDGDGRRRADAGFWRGGISAML